jgi:hypothetical protein
MPEDAAVVPNEKMKNGNYDFSWHNATRVLIE